MGRIFESSTCSAILPRVSLIKWGWAYKTFVEVQALGNTELSRFIRPRQNHLRNLLQGPA